MVDESSRAGSRRSDERLLADMYGSDEYGIQDPEKEVYWLKRAAAAGDLEAKKALKAFDGKSEDPQK